MNTERHLRHGRRVVGLCMLLTALAGVTVESAAAAEREFTVRHRSDIPGAIDIVGNAVMSCRTSASNCAAARSGGDFNDNDFDMRWVDVDGDSSTFNSSSATLTLPASTEDVVFAGLYWGADTSENDSSGDAAPNRSQRNRVLLRAPGGAYQQVTASQLDDATGSQDTRFQAFADVTATVRAARSGSYTLANLQAGEGEDRYGGWALVVVRRDSQEPPRNLTVFDGMVTIQASRPSASFSVSGFQTPPSGAVRSTVGAISYEGDRAFTGDSLELAGRRLQDARNPSDNFFNSTISRLGTPFTARNPDYANTLGFDADQIGADGYLANGATSATIATRTGGETYFPHAFTIATELYAPRLVSTKTVRNVTTGGDGSSGRRGDTLRYRIALTNEGQDASAGTLLTDRIPAGTSYVPGSTRLVADPSGSTGTLTDASGDDRGSFDPTQREVRVRLGRSATSSAGGRLQPGDSAVLEFDVTLDDDRADGDAIVNSAEIAFTGQQTGLAQTVRTPEVRTTAAAPNLVPAKTHTGAFARGGHGAYTLTVRNAGAAPTSGTVRIVDQLPVGLTPRAATGQGWTCTTVARQVTCETAAVASPGTSLPAISLEVDVATDAPDAVVNVATTSGGGDRTPGDDRVEDPTSIVAQSDLVVAKSVVTDPPRAGAPITYRIVVRNDGPTGATGVRVTDALPLAVLLPSATTTRGSCALALQNLTCTVGALASGASATITVSGTLSPTAALIPVTNTATVTGDQPDPDLASNSSSVTHGVSSQADLQLDKSVDDPAPAPGDDVVFTLVASNGGPSDARGASVTDTLPDGLLPLSALPDRGTCAIDGATVSCALGTLPAGAQARIAVRARVDAAAAGATLRNDARASSDMPDPDPVDNAASATLVVRAADLQTSKRLDGDLVRGARATYAVRVRNSGDAPTAGPVLLTDTLPSALTPVGAAGDGWTCEIDQRTVTCRRADALPPGGEFPAITIASDVASDAPDTLANTATAAGGNEADPSDNAATTTDSVVSRADLALSKTGPETVAAGGRIAWTLTADNAGPSDATDVEVLDTLPSGLADVAATVDAGEGACTVADGRVRCEIERIADAASAVIIVTARVPVAAADRELVNTATVQGAQDDPDPADNAAGVRTEVGPAADLRVTKTFAPDPPVAGAEVRFTIRAVNGGPSTATGVVISDELPEGVTVTGIEADRGPCERDGRILTCRPGGLELGESATVVVSGNVARGAGESALSNVATVSGEQPDPDGSDNASQTRATVASQADVEVEKALQGAAVAGRRATWTLTARNRGPSRATAVELVDELPATVSDVRAEGSGCAVDGRRVTCALGTLEDGATITREVSGLVDAGAASVELRNRATVDAAQRDPEPADNTAETVDPIGAVADVSVDLRGPAGPVRSGREFTWTITVRNDGPSDARDVVLRDPAPTGLRFVSADDPTCVVTASSLDCALGTLPAGEERTVVLRAVSDAAFGAGDVVNRVSVASGTPDPDLDDREATRSVRIVAPDLELSKTHAPEAVRGAAVAFTLRVRNAGSAATDEQIVVQDGLPAGLRPTAAAGDGWGCDVEGQDVRCTRSDALEPEASAPAISISADVLQGAEDRVVNVAGATGGGDPDGATASDEVAVASRADLVTGKTVSPDPPVAGSRIVYTVTVRNDGPSTASGVSVTDAVPAAVLLPSATPSQGDCSVEASTVQCALGDLADGAQATVTIAGTLLASSATGDITNTATATSATPDPDPSDNAGSVTHGTTRSADLSLRKEADDPTPDPGADFTYRLEARNDGPSQATGVEIVDELPEGITLRGARLEGGGTCEVEDREVRCTAGAVAPGATATAVLDVTAGADQAGRTIENLGTVLSPTPDPDTADRRATATVRILAADVRVTKTREGDLVRGAGALYELTVRNAGEAPTQGIVEVADTLPDGVEPVSASGDGWTCEIDGTAVVCRRSDRLVPGESHPPIRLRVRVLQDAPDEVTNVARVTGGGAPGPEGDTGTESGTVTSRSDLSIAKTAPARVATGSVLPWTLVVENAGPSDATGVVLRDTLPEDLGEVELHPGAGTCEREDREVTCRIPRLAADASATIVIEAQVPVALSDRELVNRVTVDGDQPDPDEDDRSDETRTAVDSTADLSITKRFEPDPPRPGEPVAFLLEARNAGPSRATGVEIVDELPDGVDVTAISAQRGTCARTDGTVRCEVGSLEVGETAGVRIEGIVGRGAGESALSNVATVEGSERDPDTSDNASEARAVVSSQADLEIEKTATTERAVAGGTVEWRLAIRNRGPSRATGVEVVDELPAGVTFGEAAGADCSAEGRRVTCRLEALEDGASELIVLRARSDAGGAGTTLENVATVDAGERDPEPDDNSSTAPPLVLDGRAELVLGKTGPSTPVFAGDEFEYVLRVENRGPSVARGVGLIDPLPPETTFRSSTGGECALDEARVLRCAVGSIAPGETTIVRVRVTARRPADGVLNNTASVTSETPDAGEREDASATTTIQAPVLSLTKTHDRQLRPDGDVVYRITVRNAGDAATREPIRVVDHLPPGVSASRAGGEGWACELGGAQVSCVRTDPLAPDAAAPQILIEGRVGPSPPSILVNGAGAVSDGAVGAVTQDPGEVIRQQVAGEQILACSDRRLVLTDVDWTPRRDRVRLRGQAQRSLAGRTVVVFADGRRVGSAKVAADGSFTRTAPRPAARRVASIRYQARIGSERTLNLKLSRRMSIERVKVSSRIVRFSGRVSSPRLRGADVQLRLRVTCSRDQAVGTATVRRDGRFSVRVRAPRDASSAVYRLVTRVHFRGGGPRTFRTFTLPVGVDF